MQRFPDLGTVTPAVAVAAPVTRVVFGPVEQMPFLKPTEGHDFSVGEDLHVAEVAPLVASADFLHRVHIS